MTNSQQNIALVHDYLREYGGAERVLEALHEMYPEAPVYVAFIDKKALGIHWKNFADWEIRETWLARVPFIKKLYSPLRILADKAFRDLDLSAYDVVISSSNAYMAKAVTAPQGKHICYCHTPPRSLYGYNTMTDWRRKPILRFFGGGINHYMRVVDVKISQLVDNFIANSQETQQRIEKFYRRDSTVIYPPVNLPDQEPKQRQTGNKEPDNYYLYVGRLAFAKHPEIAVASAMQLGYQLKVVGGGKMYAQLAATAGPNIELLGAVTDAQLHQLYAAAKALIFPVEDEDFGIVPVEAMGHGLPVIAHKSGGPQETIKDGVTGVFFNELTVGGLNDAIRRFEELESNTNTAFNRQQIYKHAQQFSKSSFQQRMAKFVNDC